MMELDDNPEALNAEILEGMTLKQLQGKLDKLIIAGVSRSGLLSFFMKWFNEQIKQDIFTQEGFLLEEFIGLLLMSNHAEVEPFSLTEIDKVFNQWLEKDANEEPAYRRRYLMIQQDMHRLFSRGSRYTQNLRALSLFGVQGGRQKNYSSALSCEQGDEYVRATKEATDKLQEGGPDKTLSGTQDPRSPTTIEVIEIYDDKFNQSNGSMATNARELNCAYSQEADLEEVTVTRETIVLDSSPDTRMPHTPTERDHGANNYKTRSRIQDFSTPPPKGYICKRCREPGHWIQLCPTNLDPSYDQPPAHDYRCIICDQQGHHFATLCPKNRRDVSLTKQRERAKITEAQQLRTPTRNHGYNYRDRESPTIRCRDRSRSRSLGHCRRYRGRADVNRPDGSPKAHDDDEHRHHSGSRDESDTSPYTTRARLTLELHKNLNSTEERESSSQAWGDPSRFERRPKTTPALQQGHYHAMKKGQKWHKDLDKIEKRTDEGRLAYDDEIHVPIAFRSSPHLPMVQRQRHATVASIGRENVSGHASSSVMTDPGNLDDAKDKTDAFLQALAAEFLFQDETIPRSMIVHTHEVEIGLDDRPAAETYLDDNDCSDAVAERESQVTPSDPGQRVLGPQFSREIVSLFENRENPIIHGKAKRKTAYQMMKASEGFLVPPREQTDKLATVHLPLSHRLSKSGVNDDVGLN